MFKIRNLVYLLIISSLFVSCRSLLQANRLADCQYEFDSFSNVLVAGTSLDGVTKLSDLSFFDAGKITAGFLKGDLPMSLTANVAVINPNKRTAAVNSVEWIVLIDDKEIATGELTERFEVAPNGGKALMPLKMNIDLAEALKSKDKGNLMNFAFNLTGKGGILPSEVTIKVKPALKIGNKQVKIPGYITVKQKITNSK